MKFAVLGSGGVGAYFGGRLAQAGHDVTFVARGAHLAAMRAKGLRVDSTEGDFSLQEVDATDETASIGPVDIAILAVKTWQVKEVAPSILSCLREDSAVLTLQNGVEAPDEVARVCGAGRTIAGLCRLMSYVAQPGVVRHAGVKPTIAFGEFGGPNGPRVEGLRSAFSGCAGVTPSVPDDIRVALWDKFLFIAPFSAMGAVTRKPAGLWRHVPETRAMLEGAMREVVALAQARGVPLAYEAVARTLTFTDNLPLDSTASMQRDLLEGRPSELEAQTGAIVRLAKEARVTVPVNEFLYASLLPAEIQTRTS